MNADKNADLAYLRSSAFIGGQFLFLLRGSRRRGLLANLFEVLLHHRLQRHRHFVSGNLGARLRMLRALARVGRAQLLIGGLHFDRRLASQVCRALAQNLADLSHGRELLGVLDILIAILAADAAAGLLARLLGIALALALALLRVFGVLGFLAVLAFLRVALLALLRRAFLAVLLLRPLLRLAGIRLLLFLRSLLLTLLLLRLHAREQILERVLHLAHQRGFVVGVLVLLAFLIALLLGVALLAGLTFIAVLAVVAFGG